MKNNSSHSTSMLDAKKTIMVCMQTVAVLFAITLATGAPPMAAMVTGSIGAIALIISSIASGSRFSIQPPIVSIAVAGTIILAFGYQGAVGVFVMAALIQSVLGITRIGRVLIGWFSPAAVKGIIAALALTLIAQQFYVWMGLGTQYGKDLWTLLAVLPQQVVFFNPQSLILGIVLFSITGLLFLMKHDITQGWQIPIVAVVMLIGTGLGYLIQGQSYIAPTMDISSILLNMQYAETWQFWYHAVTLAVLGTLQIVSRMQIQQESTKVSKHLTMLGLTNLAVGFFGGLPLQAKIHKYNSPERSFLLYLVVAVVVGFMLIVMMMVPLLSFVPMTALAVVVMSMASRYIQPDIWVDTYHSGTKNFVVFTLALVAGLWTDYVLVSLLVATGVDKIWSYIRMVKPTPIYLYNVDLEEKEGGYHATLTPTDFFADACVLEDTLAQVPSEAELHIDVSRCDKIQPGFYEAIERAAQARVGKVFLVHDHDDVQEHIWDHYPHLLN